MLDGMVAVERGVASRTGELFNEIPDRVSDAATILGFGFVTGGSVALAGVASSLAVIVAYTRAMGVIVTGRNELCGPMAKQQRMFLLVFVALFFAVAPVSLRTIPLGSIGQVRVASITLAVICVGCVVTAWRRLARVRKALKGVIDA